MNRIFSRACLDSKHRVGKMPTEELARRRRYYKKRGSRSCRAFGRAFFRASRQLELDAKADLNLPGGIYEVAVGVGGRSERGVECQRIARDSIACAIVPACANHTGYILFVGKVEDVTDQFQFIPLLDLEVLGDAHIRDPCHGLAESVAAGDIDAGCTARTVDTAIETSWRRAAGHKGIRQPVLDLKDRVKLPVVGHDSHPSFPLPG